MVSTEKSQSFFAGFLQYLLVALTALGTILILGWLLKYSAYGIDFTDEGFYLVWISNPFIYDASITQFGFIYHPLYSLLGGDIIALRQANILITFGLAWGLIYTFLASFILDFKESRITLCTIAAGLATCSLILFDSGLMTPNYNSLTLQSLLVSAIGLLLAKKTIHRTSLIGWVLIGIGGWMTFMAKPSTALVLIVGVFICILLSGKFSIRMLALTVACTLMLLLISALLIDGSVLRFVERLQLGIEFSKYLGGGHTLTNAIRIDNFHIDGRTNFSILLVFMLLLIALTCMWAKKKKWLLVGLLISIAFFTITTLLALGKIHRTAGFGRFQDLLVFGLVYAMALTGLLLGYRKTLATVKSSQWIIACFFCIMPYLYTFGTNRNYWQHSGSASIFWLLAGLTFLVPLVRECSSWLLMLPLALAVQAVTGALLQTGLEQPYRQTQPLRLNASTLEFGPHRSALVLSEGYAQYISRAISTAREAAFEPRTPMIDLSGQSPGILYAMGAKSIGQPWTLGGYPGSLLFVKAGLTHTSCEEIASAWLLFEPNGTRSIPIDLMLSFGAKFPSGYTQVGSWYTAKGAGGGDSGRRQELYKPKVPNDTLIACKALRGKL